MKKVRMKITEQNVEAENGDTVEIVNDLANEYVVMKAEDPFPFQPSEVGKKVPSHSKAELHMKKTLPVNKTYHFLLEEVVEGRDIKSVTVP